jgi:hypothetical protein
MHISEDSKAALSKSIKYHREEFLLPVASYIIMYVTDSDFESPVYLQFLQFVTYCLPFITIIRIYMSFRKFRNHKP